MAKPYKMLPGSNKKTLKNSLATVPEEPSLFGGLDIEAATMSPNHEHFALFDPTQSRIAPYGRPTSVLKVALYASLAWNVVLACALTGYYYREPPSQHHNLSRYARLPRQRTAWNFGTMYGSRALEDEQRADRLWEDQSSASGVVALRHVQARHWHLPQSQSFDRDPEYGLYVVAGMHSMNCLQKLRRSVVQSYHGGEVHLEEYADLLQCADVLRQEIMCHADDTPMYLSTSQSRTIIGEGQTRMCRNWARLEEWYEANSECVDDLDQTADGSGRKKECPSRNKFASEMREYLSQPDHF